MENTNTANKITTNCKNCVFAKFFGPKQIGCELSRIERFDLNGKVNVVKNSDHTTSCVIDRFCNCYRDKDSEWASYIDKRDYVKSVLYENILSHTIVVVFDKNDKDTDLVSFFDSCLNSIILPTEVIILNRKNTRSNKLEGDIISKLEDSGILWKNIRIFDSVPNNMLLNELKNRISTQYFSVFNLPGTLPTDFITKLHNSLNERLERFILLKSHKGQGLTIQTLLFNVLDGCLPKLLEDNGVVVSDIQEKIETVARINNENHLIKNVNDL